MSLSDWSPGDPSYRLDENRAIVARAGSRSTFQKPYDEPTWVFSEAHPYRWLVCLKDDAEGYWGSAETLEEAQDLADNMALRCDYEVPFPEKRRQSRFTRAEPI